MTSRAQRIYLTEQSAGSIIRNTFQLYFRHFWSFLLIVLSTVAVPNVVAVHALKNEDYGLYVGALAAAFLMGIPAGLAIVVLVSDVCRGNPVDTIGALRRGYAWSTPKLLVIYLVMTLAPFTIGLPLLLVRKWRSFMAWFMFAAIVRVIERASVGESFRRSRHLGEGFYWRNLGLVMLTFLVATVPIYLVTGVLQMTVTIMKSANDNLGADIFVGSAGVVGSPLYAIAPILLYYEMRVRKEAFDHTLLTEELAI